METFMVESMTTHRRERTRKRHIPHRDHLANWNCCIRIFTFYLTWGYTNHCRNPEYKAFVKNSFLQLTMVLPTRPLQTLLGELHQQAPPPRQSCWCAASTTKAGPIYLRKASPARVRSENIGHVIFPKG